MGQAGRLNLKLINDYEERKAFSLVSSINNTQKNLHDPMALRARDISSKESPLGMHEINDLRFLAQQQKKMIKAGVNIDNLFLDGGTGGPGKISIGSAVHNKKPSPAAHNRKPGHHRVVSTAAGIQKAGRESEEHSEEGMGHADHTKKMASNYPPSNSLKSKSLKIQKGGNLTYEEHVASKKPYKLVVDRSKKPEEEARRVQSRLGHHRRREIEEEEEREEENRPQIEHRDILMELDDEIFRTLDHEQFGILSARSKEVNQLVTVIRKCTHPRLTRYSNPADRPGA